MVGLDNRKMELLPRVRWQTRVSDGLSLMAYLIKARARLGMNDAAVALESTVATLLNELCDWKLENLNLTGPNYPAADLGDRRANVAVQVTIQGSGLKIKKTAKTAKERGLENHFEKLIIFFLLPKKPAFPEGFQEPAGLKIETMDIADLTRSIGSIDDISKLERIAKIVEDEVGRNLYSANAEREELSPKLHARFQEVKDELWTEDLGDCTSYHMSLWIENPPCTTRRVVYDILHESFTGSPWTIDRGKYVVLEFETDDMQSYGDVDIWVRGIGKGVPDWRLKSTLYDALVNEYSSKLKDKRVAKAMRDIRNN